MKIREFFDQTNTPEQLKNFITSNNLLFPPMCWNYETKIQLHRSTKLGLIFRCNKKFSIFKSECFKGMKINLQDFFGIIYFFVHKVNITETVAFLGINRKTISDYYFSFRNPISASLINTNTTLGGVDRIVQIDECLALKRKYNCSRFKPEIWLFGGIDILTQKAFLIIVPDRKWETFFPIIFDKIMQTSIIHTDCFSVYPTLSNVVDQNNQTMYSHYTVNHSENFVDPIIRIYTKNIEGFFLNLENSLINVQEKEDTWRLI